eukprot:COSAG01_NODE_424_length_17253_cov_31.601900_28_plen_92_part_00
MDITELQGQQPASEESQELSRRISDLGRRFGSQIWVAELRFGSQIWVADLGRSLRTLLVARQCLQWAALPSRDWSQPVAERGMHPRVHPFC